jgi:hypothetical protein
MAHPYRSAAEMCAARISFIKLNQTEVRRLAPKRLAPACGGRGAVAYRLTLPPHLLEGAERGLFSRIGLFLLAGGDVKDRAGDAEGVRKHSPHGKAHKQRLPGTCGMCGAFSSKTLYTR